MHADKDKSGVSAHPIDPANLTHLKGTFPGPPDTPYAGGTYTVDIQIPDMYPFKSPVMKFDTKMWHPNISSQTVSSSPAFNNSSIWECGGHLFLNKQFFSLPSNV